MGAIGPVLQAVGIGLTLSSGAKDAAAREEAGRVAQAAGEYNAMVSEQNAVLAQDRAAKEETRYRISAKRQLGAIDAAYAASGVSRTGSATDVILDSAMTAERDALEIRQGGRWEAFGYRTQAEISRRYGGEAAQGAAREAGAVRTSAAAQALLSTAQLVNQPT